MARETTFGTASRQKSIPPVGSSAGSTRIRLAHGRGFRARAEQGSAMMEMAFAMIILLSVLFGVIEICLALYSYHFISDAAREGSRYAMVRGSACQAPGNPCPVTATEIQTYIRDFGFPGISPSAMTVTTAWSAYPAGGTCSPSASCNNPGNLVTVTVKYKFPLSIPFVPSSNISMSSTSAMVISQ